MSDIGAVELIIKFDCPSYVCLEEMSAKKLRVCVAGGGGFEVFCGFFDAPAWLWCCLWVDVVVCDSDCFKSSLSYMKHLES